MRSLEAAGVATRQVLAYRPDIDGLRAIAVVAVILYHAGIAPFQGGFAGVDVFFVISGYLITGMLLAVEGQRARTILSNFYLRRARRILPALLVMLACVVMVGCWWLSPVALRNLGSFVALGSISLGNIAAWKTGGYFGLVTQDRPLLHLWSLGIEEQFYLVYPLLFLGLLKLPGRARLRWVIWLAILSLALCVWASWARPLANYYLTPTRAWELLLGGALALRPLPVPGSRLAAELRAGAALLALPVLLVTLPRYVPYPGLVTLVPCLATAVLIAPVAGPPTLAARVLAWRPLVFLGLVSYSLYLWHLPLIALFSDRAIFALGTAQLATLFAVLLAISVASWAFIERPLRAARVWRSNRLFVAMMCITTLAFIVIGGTLAYSDGFPGRFKPQVRRLYEGESRYPPRYAAHCLRLADDRIAAGELCRFGSARGDAPAVVLWGDSHALALLPAFEQIASNRGDALYFAAKSACRPLSGVDGQASSGTTLAQCSAFNAAMTVAVQRLRPHTVVLAARWSFPDLDPQPLPSLAVPAGRENFERGLVQTLRNLGSLNPVCVVADVPRMPVRVSHSLAVAARRGIDSATLTIGSAEALRQHAAENRVFESLRAQGLVRIADPAPAICAGERCRLLTADGWPVYGDWDHLTRDGSMMVKGALETCFSDARATTH